MPYDRTSAEPCDFAVSTQYCNGTNYESVGYVTAEGCFSHGGSYSQITCDDDGITLTSYDDSSCTGEGYEYVLAGSDECTKIDCYGNGMPDTLSPTRSPASGDLYVDIGRRRNNKQRYVCELLNAGRAPIVPHLPAPASPNSPKWFDFGTREMIFAVSCAMNIMLLAVWLCKGTRSSDYRSVKIDDSEWATDSEAVHPIIEEHEAESEQELM